MNCNLLSEVLTAYCYCMCRLGMAMMDETAKGTLTSVMEVLRHPSLLQKMLLPDRLISYGDLLLHH